MAWRVRRWSHGLALLVGSLLALPMPAQASCEGLDPGPVKVDVRVEVPAPRINRTLSRRDISALQAPGPGQRTIGLTQARMEVNRSARYLTLPVADGHCFRLDSIDVTLRLSALDVFVAAEYAPGSCSYEAILAHEHQHVAVAEDYIALYGERLRAALEAPGALGPSEPQLVADVGAAGEAVDRRIERVMHPLHDEIQAATAAAQDALDTPESYAAVRRECRDW